MKSTNKKLWRILLLAALVVLMGAMCLVMASCKQEQTAQGENHLDIYWNVERAQYVAANEDGTSGRFPRGDGYYYVRLAANGEQVDYPVQDYNLVNRIDMLDYFVPVFDDNGVIVDLKTVNDCTGGLLAPALYVSAVDGNKVVANTQGTFLGIDIPFEIDEETEVYTIDGTSLLTGTPGVIEADDEVIAIKDLDGTIGTVFVKGYTPPGDIYWNIYRKYNSTAKVTTRDADALGYYNFEMAINGEVKTFRTRDYKVANAIDAWGPKCVGLEFDENGDISAMTKPDQNGCKGTFGSWYHITDINGNVVTAERIAAGTDQGNIMTAPMAPNCKVVDVSAVGGYSGAYTELQVGDQIHGLKDQRGRIAYIFVHVRLSDESMPLYWNCARKYNSTTMETTRKPDAEGWYYAQVATGGKQITVKTKDKALMSSLDSYAARCFTMRLKGDNEIAMLGAASAAHGGGTFGSWYYVDKIEGDQVTVSRILTGDTEPTVVTGTMSKDIEIINGSTNYKSHCGEYTELQVGDRVHGLTDLRKQIRVLFVVDRPVDVPMYWNVVRNYNSTAKETTKKPDADGFYWFTLAVKGEQVKLKTRSKTIANQIDSNAARCCGLRVWNGEITQVIGAGSVKGYSGGTRSISWVDVISLEGQYAVCQKNQAGHALDGKKFNVYIGNACEIYDVSEGYMDYAGEPTTLRVGDRIHAFHNGEGIAMLVYVVGGRVKPLNVKPNDCPCAQGVTWEPWDGTTELQDGKSYYLTGDVVAPEEGFYLENIAVNLRLDGHTISSSGRCFYTHTGAKLNICDHGTRGKLVGTGISGESGGVIRMYTSSGGANINLWNIDVICNEDSTPAKEGGAISCAGPITLHNVNVRDGVASTKGGNVTISIYGTFRMFGGSLENGNAQGGNGGNMNGEGVFYLENVTMSAGKASGSGDNLFIGNAGYEKRINGLTATGGDVTLNAGNLGVLGTVKADLTMGSGTMLVNKGISADSKIDLTMKSEGTVLSLAETDLSGIFTNTDLTGDYVLRYDSEGKQVVMDCTIVPQTHDTDHCACAGVDTGLSGHSCEKLTGWTEITDAVFEKAIGINGNSAGIKFKKSGNYYLSVPYTLKGALNIMPDQDITICLNGCRLTGSSQIGKVAGKLTVTDCTGTGQVYSTANSTNGNTFKVLAGGELNIFAGTYTAQSSCTDGGVVVVSQDKANIAPADCTEPGVFNFYGGTITGGNAKNGGNVILWHTSQFNMYGGTISDGTATSGENLRVSNSNAEANLLGGTIKNGNVLTTAGKINLGGSVKIDELVSSTGNIAVSGKGLKSDAEITITKPGVGTLVSGVDSTKYTCFTFADTEENVQIEYVAEQKAIVGTYQFTHNHCVCGGVKPAGHSCSNEGWMPLSAETIEDYFSVSSSRYVAKQSELYLYLTEDLDLSYSINLNEGSTIHLCLNGFDLTHTKTTNPVMRVWGDLDLTDCSAGRGGSIIGHRTGESPCLYVQNWVGSTNWCNTTVNMYAGTLTADDGDTSAKAGVIQIGNKVSPNRDHFAVFNMYGGKICGGDANNGGNVYLEGRDVVFNMYGGTITEGYASSSGGGIYSSSADAQVNILGGSIIGNTAKAHGPDMYTTSTAKVTFGGTIRIGEYYSNSIVLTLKNLNAASNIKILRNGDAPAVFATGADTDVAKCFTNPSMTAVWNEADKTLSFDKNVTPPPVVESNHKHCICADASGMPDSHKCSDTAFQEIKQADFDGATATSSPVYTYSDGTTTRYALRDGSYYLGENITVTHTITMTSGANVRICLNGKTLHGKNMAVFFTKGTVAITDCVHTTNADGTHTYTGQVTSTYTGHAPIIYARMDSNVSVYGGNFVGSKLGAGAQTGGGVFNVGGVLNIYDGKLYGGDASATSYNGGNGMIADNGTLNMYGGSIEGGKVKSSQSGGSIRINSGTLNMYGGKITGGWAKEGGNIAIGSSCTFNLYGGTVENGTASANGGNVIVFGTFNMTGGTVQNGTATGEAGGGNGGNITCYANKSVIKISGGLITGGKASLGANLRMRTSASVTVYLTITGGKIEGMKAGSDHSVSIPGSSRYVTTIGGDAVIDELYIEGSSTKLTVSADKPLTAKASINIHAAAEQVVATGAAALTGLKSYNDEYELVLDGTNVKFVKK